MDENKESVGILERLALLGDSAESIFRGKTTIVFQLKGFEFDAIRRDLKIDDSDTREFKVDISGTDFIFLLDE
jgi:hypothetical protein